MVRIAQQNTYWHPDRRKKQEVPAIEGQIMQIVTAAVIEKDGKILIARRKEGDQLEGRWEFPGGKLEPGETPEEGLKRELREEFGIETAIGEPVGSSSFAYPHLTIELLAYRATVLSGAIKVRDHDEIRWVLPEDLPRHDFCEADRPIVRKLLELDGSVKREA
jgi:8-oxo-dGTP diphosphatase